ncbi:MAG: ABC transporter permease [Candidatus Nealsonbacteria bacterium]|nr:ABC transporter permease [Candidatus Nealsonbacteria bacterium]
MPTIKLLLCEIGYRKLNFALSLFAMMGAAVLFVVGPMLIEGYSQATETELEVLEDRVVESAGELALAEKEAAEALKLAEAEAAAELFQLEDQTRLIMIDLGFNLSVLHKDADTVEFLLTGRVTHAMPQDWIDTLAADPGLTMVTHLVATLNGEIEFDGKKVRLRGYRAETPQPHKPKTKFAQKVMMKKTPMGYDIKPGTAQIGYALGQGRKVGETIEVDGRQYTIATILTEKGSVEDVTMAMHLSDAQELLDQPGVINQIMALECKCAMADLPKIRAQIGDALPETHVIRDMSKANARLSQRTMVRERHDRLIAQQQAEHRRIIAAQQKALEEREDALKHTGGQREKIQSLMGTLSAAITPLVVLVSAVWVGLLALSNVRERRVEIGILRAIGKGSGSIATLFLGKAVLLGLLGATIGCVAGVATVGWLVPRMLDVPTDFATSYLGNHYLVPLLALLGAPLLAAAASYLPTLSALSQDPAVVLRDR